MSTITFELREHRELPEDHRDYRYLYYQDWYLLTIEVTDDWVSSEGTYKQIFVLEVEASKSTSLRRNGKLIDEDIGSDDIDFTLPDPGENRINAVMSVLKAKVVDKEWLQKLIDLV